MDIAFKLKTETIEQAGLVEPLCVDPQATVREVLERLRQQRTGSVLVCRDGALVGIFTERDALRLMARMVHPETTERARGELDAPIENLMVAFPVTLKADDTIGSAVLRMSSGGYRRMPIVNGGGRPVGVLQVSGIVHYLVQHFPKMVYNLPPVPHPTMHDREGP
jgi:CBS domain-containing protein